MNSDSSAEESPLVERYKFTISYNGTAFSGFQRQGETRTVQLELENALRKLGWKEESIIGAGRTDSGVHAAGQVVSAAMEWHHGEEQLRSALNAALPPDLAVLKAEKAAADFNARYDAVLRYYQYTIFTRPVALMRDFGWECGSLNLDIEAMGREAQSFLGEHDFIDFCIPRNDGKSTLCTLSEFRLERLNDWSCMFHIKGNRFLHRQVRAMVGTLFDIGRGRYPEGTVNQIFEKKFKGERTWAPPQGLVLENVEYRDY